MGADLYIESIFDKNKEKYEPLFQAAVQKRDAFPGRSEAAEETQSDVEKYYNLMYSEGYFRDSYNDSSLLWTLGLSWWVDVSNKYIDDEGYISVESARKLISLIEPLPFMKFPEPVDGESEDDLRKYFTEKKEKFLTFLRTAVKLNEKIYASV
jgi:hypothetical protein